MKIQRTKNLFILLCLIALSGCSHVISSVNLEKADTSVSIAYLMKDPEKYKGKIIIIGGNIISVLNRSDGTWIEVLQKDLDSWGKPAENDKTLGRFIVFHEGYLDSAIYARGRLLTLAGEVMGAKKLPLGETEYNYPLIKSMELHVMDHRRSPPVRFGIGIGIGGEL